MERNHKREIVSTTYIDLRRAEQARIKNEGRKALSGQLPATVGGGDDADDDYRDEASSESEN